MRRFALFVLCALLFARLMAAPMLEQRIVLPGVSGRIDHCALDAANRRLFVAALGNNSIEVIDLTNGQVVRSIAGLDEPQGLYYDPATHQLFVANGGDGTLNVYSDKGWGLAGVIRFDSDADNLRWDETNKLLYVGHGAGALAAVDLSRMTVVADVRLPTHPESFQLERRGTRTFVNLPAVHAIAVVDRARMKVTDSWSLDAAANFPLALDEPNRRLFVGCRLPSRLLVYDTETGRQVDRLELHGDCDDLFYDSARRLVYASCGEGFLDIVRQVDADHYTRQESVRTAERARTCLLAEDRLFVAAPRHGIQPAQILCYRLDPIVP